MMDWLASKIGVLIAIAVLTTFVLGLFAWQHSALVDREGQAVADRISGTLDALASVESSTVVNISYGTGNDRLPLTIGGDSYTVNISSDSVTIACGEKMWTSRLAARVIPHDLARRSLNLSDAEALDFLAWSGERASGDGFSAERALIEVSGEARYITLVYWAGDDISG